MDRVESGMDGHGVVEYGPRNTMAQAALVAPGLHHGALRDIVAELMDLAEVRHFFAELMSRVDQGYPTPGRGTPTEATNHEWRPNQSVPSSPDSHGSAGAM